MMKLKDLVPPLELCKLIPEGEFGESVFVWCIDNVGTVILCERENTIHTEGWQTIPAPILPEFMAELPASNIYRIRQTWTANFINDSVNNGIKSTNPATAALKLWFKLKGIEG